MRLDNDCIRDIMLYIEDHTDYEKSRTDVDTLCDFFEDKYDLNKDGIIDIYDIVIVAKDIEVN